MAGSIALLKTDLSRVLAFTPGASGPMVMPPPAKPPTNAREYRKLASETSHWLASQPGTKRRYAGLIVDIDECICRWVKGASAAPPVLTAALRQQSLEWGDAGHIGFVEPVTDTRATAKRPPLPFASLLSRKAADSVDEDALSTTSSDPAGLSLSDAEAPQHGCVAIALPDALVRLVLDGLDKHGVRVSAVLSLWHALAALTDRTHEAAGSETEPEAVVAIEPGRRVVWAWGQRGSLLAGGSVWLESASGEADAVAASSERAVRRLQLDWLSWAAQLGVVPGRVRVLGPAEHPFGRALAEVAASATPGMAVSHEAHDDGVHAVAQKLSVRPRPQRATNARQALTRLSARPNRATRQRYFTIAASLVLTAVAVTGVGYRFSQQGRAWSSAIVQVNADSLKTASVLVQRAGVPGSGLTPSAVEAELNTELARLRQRPQPRPLRQPNDIVGAIRQSLEILKRFEGEVTIEHMRISDNTDNVGMKSCIITLNVPDIRIGVSIYEAFRNESTDINWDRSASRQNSNNDKRLQLEGTWKR
jgi:hypothetical protein